MLYNERRRELRISSKMPTLQRPKLIARILLTATCLAIATHAAAEQPGVIYWPQGQALPRLPAPANILETIDVGILTHDEQLTFSALVGHANRRQPRIALLNRRSEEGPETWFYTPTVGVELAQPISESDKYSLIADFAGEVAGVVLYDAELNPHMRNLAATVAALRKALPVTREVYGKLQERGISLPLLEDLTSLTFAGPVETYKHLYDAYWPLCEKRFIVSARPEGRGGDYHHTRDLAAACGAAALWLDARIPGERELFGKFLADMPVGNAVILGWHATERSGVTTATRYGIGTMPSDHFMNATVFAGGSHEIQIPPTPKTPELENKLYVALFLSDGDNIQYVQHAMRRKWDRSAAVRGQQPLNWTIAPGLVDVAPGILNYYYSTATPNDCFVCGPSGMGYTMPVNTLLEPGAPLGSTLNDEARMDAYTKLTSRYLQRTGLRVVTVWDDLTAMQRQSFAANCPELLGVTVQNFKDDPTVASSVAKNGLRFEKLIIPYAGSYDDLQRSIEAEHAKLDGTSPRFAAYQADIWSPLQPERLVELMNEFERQNPQIEFVRADHYFELQRESRERIEADAK